LIYNCCQVLVLGFHVYDLTGMSKLSPGDFLDDSLGVVMQSCR
jgi:hypothetical protein